MILKKILIIANHDKNKSEFLTKVEKVLPFKAYLTKETKQTLASLVQSFQTSSEVPPKNNWLLIIGSITIFSITLGIVILLAKRWIKHDLQEQVFQKKKKKKKNSRFSQLKS